MFDSSRFYRLLTNLKRFCGVDQLVRHSAVSLTNKAKSRDEQKRPLSNEYVRNLILFIYIYIFYFFICLFIYHFFNKSKDVFVDLRRPQ